MTNIALIASELAITTKQVENTLSLLKEGGTVPFISRYRKEVTGSLDELQVTAIRDRMKQLEDLDKRKEAILKSIEEQGKLTPALAKAIQEEVAMARLEDLYLPYKPKRKTRASMAKERGLQPLADMLLTQHSGDATSLAIDFVNEEKGVKSVEDALAGARDILAEVIMEDANVREIARKIFLNEGKFMCRVIPGKEDVAIKYKDYYDWTEPLKSAPSHRVLAMRRGEKEELLYLSIEVDEDSVMPKIESLFIKTKNTCADHVKLAIADGYKRLLKPAMETELRVLTRQKADEEAIRVFAENARQLLLAAPLGQKRIIAIDPGFRTGCKTVVLDEQGTLVQNLTIYPHNGTHAMAESSQKIAELVKKYKIEAIAIGNGTAGRETEEFVKKLDLSQVTVVMVNESGASIYSASDVAREEFPDHDLTVRGAISIGRRLMDPLAELVKIDPKSIGVGQYQHDVDQNKLQTSLDDTVISCVNTVGVELNTASKQILAYVSGLGPALAQQIVAYRAEHGAFTSRKELKKVPRLGAKAFEQAAGFLRIRNAKNPLDRSAVHPERYALVEQMAKDMHAKVEDLLKDEDLRNKIDLKKYSNEEVGLPTLKDILHELAKPGLDPREQFEAFAFAEGINKITDLYIGMKLPGIVTNITKFGAFVDIGVHQDGLVHVSQLSNRFVSDPNEVVKVQQKVEVTVTEVDVIRNRIALSMKTEEKKSPAIRKPKENQHKAKEQENMADRLKALANRFK